MIEDQPDAATISAAQPHDIVDDASLDSFPASDPPGWSGFRVGAPVHRTTGVPTDVAAPLQTINDSVDVGARPVERPAQSVQSARL